MNTDENSFSLKQHAQLKTKEQTTDPILKWSKWLIEKTYPLELQIPMQAT